MNLPLYLVKQALNARRDLSRQSRLAQQQHELAQRRSKQYELINDLVRNTQRSPFATGAKGAVTGAGIGSLGMIPLSLLMKSHMPIAAGAVIGGVGGGLIGGKIPSWSRSTLTDYAAGRDHPVFWGGKNDSEFEEAPLGRAQRQLVGRVVRGL